MTSFSKKKVQEGFEAFLGGLSAIGKSPNQKNFIKSLSDQFTTLKTSVLPQDIEAFPSLVEDAEAVFHSELSLHQEGGGLGKQGFQVARLFLEKGKGLLAWEESFGKKCQKIFSYPRPI